MSADSKREVVVVTGASSGVGRAIAHAFAKRGAQIGLAREGRAWSRGRAPRGRVRSAARRSCCRPTSPTTRRSRRPPWPSRQRFGPIDVWVNDAMATVFAPFLTGGTGGVQARDRGHLPRHRVRHDGGACADGAARPRHRRAGRLGARLPRNPAAIGLLRREVRDPRVHRFGAHRADARPQPRLDHDGAVAGRQHAPVQLVPHEAAGPPAAGAADLPARGPGRGGLLGSAPSPPRARRRRQRGQGDLREQALAALRRLVPGAHRLRIAADRGHAGRTAGPTTSSSRCPRRPRRTACSTARRTPAATSSGRTPTGRSSPGRSPGVAAAAARRRALR